MGATAVTAEPAEEFERPRFTSEQAKEAGRLSGEARRKKREEREAVVALARAARVRAIERTAEDGGDVVGGDLRSELWDLRSGALEAANLLVDRVLTGAITIRHAGDLATLLEKLHTIYRLESGESTANTLHLSLTARDALDQLQGMRDVTGD